MARSRTNHARRKLNSAQGRSADFPVRQWLKLGAASAGMGAALLGFSLMGPSTGTAAADSPTDTTSASPRASSSADSDESSSTTDAASDSTDAGEDADDDADDRASSKGSNSRRDTADTDTDTDTETESDAAEIDTAAEGVQDRAAKPNLVRVASAPVTVEDDAAVQEEDEEPPAEVKQPPAPAPPWLRERKTWDDVVADVLEKWNDDTVAWINNLNASDDAKANLEAAMRSLRRTFFNQAPTVDPVQIEGLLGGAISGKVDAEDADGDELVYRLVTRPKFGTVVFDDDGGYTYTPGEGFLGVDTFRVMAIDAGLHVNLLNPFRRMGTTGENLINQNAIRFDFTYEGDEWTEERREKLEEVAASLTAYFRVREAVTLTFDVNEEDKPGTLASAGSERISTAAGYWRTVVQNKLQTGEDANGEEADGEISWNWGDGNEWALGDEVSSEEFDFTSVAIHEMMHAFGWGSTLQGPGENQGANREEYDRFIVSADGRSVFTNGQWSSVNDPKLTGGDRGLYFGGKNAVEAYGGYLVPLRTSTIWGGASSISHLSDATFAGDDQKIMNSGTDEGPAPRVFSEVELGVLEDLGYYVVNPENPPYATDEESEESEENGAEDGAEDGGEDEAEPARPPVAAPTALSPRRTWAEVVADIVDGLSARNQEWIDSLDVSDERKAELEESFATFRTTFLNRAPTVDPVQVTGLVAGVITGQINGEDADGDAIRYRIVSGPRQGSVVLNVDGTWTYTPGAAFDGVDSFRVMAIDSGLHVNLLNPFRGIGTSAFNLINQNAIRFVFNYTGDDWTEDRQDALEQVARDLQEYFRVNRPVTLTYDVNLEDPEDPERGLASATSPYISKLPGYWDTVVQHKLQTGRDANGDRADGTISWNFADHEWALDGEVTADEYDFVTTAIHELMHSFGFLSSLGEPGENLGANRSRFDRLMVNVRGTRVFFLAEWATLNDSKLTGDDGALYFGGSNAIEAYDGYLIPLFTPGEFEGGSSFSHLDDFTFDGDDQKIMNAKTDTGPGVRIFSEMELAILRDLGYHVVTPATPPYAVADRRRL